MSQVAASLCKRTFAYFHVEVTEMGLFSQKCKIKGNENDVDETG